jgi:uncharacterized protein YlxP (DUF503 family)
MTIGVLKLSLFIPFSNSLKEKRMVLSSFRQRLKNKFNVSVTTLNDKDKWQRIELAVVCAGNSTRAVDKLLNEVVNFTKGFNQLELIDYTLELI